MKRHTQGQALVESAFVLLVLIVTLIAIFDLGQVLFLHQTFVERARNAARYGAVRAFDAEAIRNVVLYGQPAVPEGRTGFMGLTTAMVTVTRADAGSAEDRIVITIANYPYRFFSPLIAGQFYGRSILVSAPVETP